MRLASADEVRGPCRRRMFASLAIAVVFVLLCEVRSYSQVQQPDEHASGTISGTVLNSVTSEPIGQALVYSSDDRFAAFTDDHGHFEFSLPTQPTQSAQPTPAVRIGRNAGQTILQAKKPGFLTDPGPRGSVSRSAPARKM